MNGASRVSVGRYGTLFQLCRRLGSDLLDCRLQAMSRLFRVILEVTSPAFNVENRQWRSSVIDVFYIYFTSLWADERVSLTLNFAST